MTTEQQVEAAARALFSCEQCDQRQALDLEANWLGRLNDDDRCEYRTLARAALAAATVAEPLPVVAYKGPNDTDASMFASAANHLANGYPVGGSNLTDAVIRLIRREIARAALSAATVTVTTAEDGVSLIAAERQRQIDVEGYDAEHDDGHDGDLAAAAVCYALPDWRRRRYDFPWPWDIWFWKPTPDDRVRELVKAGALIAAAIDELKRAVSS